MKKLITGAIAAIALVLGFAACSGDLHENDIQPLYIVGLAPTDSSGNSIRLPLEVISDTEQEFAFTYHHAYQMDTKFECGAWSGTPGQIAFKITKSGNPTDWSVDWGGVNDDKNGRYASVATVLKANATEYTSLNMRGSAGAPTNPGNVFIYDLVEGGEYKILVNFNAATNAVGIKIAGESSTAPDLQLVANQKYTVDSKEEYISYPMTRAGTTYTYEFIAASDIKDFRFYVKAPTLGSYYIPSDGKLSLASGIIDNFENYLDENGNITNGTDYALDLWNKSSKMDLTKNVKYKITIKADHIAQGFGGKITVSSEMEKLLDKAVVFGNWKYADTHDDDWELEVKDGVATFEAVNDIVEFKIRRETGDDTMVWGAESADKTVEIKPGVDLTAGESKALTYKTTNLADKAKFAYVEPEKEPAKTALESVGYIKATGLSKGKTYKINFDSDKGAEKLTISINEEKVLKFHEQVAEAKVKGAYDGWADGDDHILKNFPKENITEENGVFTYKISVENKQGDDTGFAYGVFSKADSDGQIYKANIDLTGKIATDGENKGKGASDKVEATFQKKDSDPTIKGVPAGAKFDILVIADDNMKKCSIQVVVTESTPPAPDNRSFAQQIVEDYYIKGSITDSNWSYDINPKEAKYFLADGTETEDGSRLSYATIKFGPFEKKETPLEWLLTNDSTFYRGVKIRYTDTANKKEQRVKLLSDSGNGTNAKITELESLGKDNYYIVITAKNKDKTVYANLKETSDPVTFKVTCVITIPGTGKYQASTLTITGVPKADNIDLNGSLFGWDGGDSVSAEYDSAFNVYKATANGLNKSGWIASESPFKDDYPDNTDTSAKLSINRDDAWYPFKDGGAYTFDFSARRK